MEGQQVARVVGRGRRQEIPRNGARKHASVNFVETADSGLRDEYVTPMFDATWGPYLAVFFTAMESANGINGALASITTKEEMDHTVDNATLAINVSLNGFQLAICVAGLCRNNTTHDAYVRALHNFTLPGPAGSSPTTTSSACSPCCGSGGIALSSSA